MTVTQLRARPADPASRDAALLYLRAAIDLVQGLGGAGLAPPAKAPRKASDALEGGLAPCPNPWCPPGSTRNFYVPNRDEVFVRCSCGMRGPRAMDEELAALYWNNRPELSGLPQVAGGSASGQPALAPGDTRPDSSTITLVPWRKRVRLGSAPCGLFLYEGTLAVKSEYGPCDCYIVASGEYFVGGVPKDKKHALLVTPLRVLAGPLVDEGGAPNLRR